MATLQPNTHAFIVKVWLEDTGEMTGKAVWRGRITHVPTGQMRHFVDVNEVADFMLPYLHQMGVRPTWRWRVRRWLRRSPCNDDENDENDKQ